MPSLRNKIIRLAYEQPDFRDRLLPLVKDADYIVNDPKKKTLANVAQMIGLLAESGGDLVDALEQNEPPEQDWKARYWNLWEQNYPHTWPDIKILVKSIESWAARIARPLLNLHVEYSIQQMADNPFSYKNASGQTVASAWIEFSINIVTLQKLWENAMPDDPGWAAAYKKVWSQYYPRGWKDLSTVAQDVRWTGKTTAAFEEFAKTYNQRNRYIQAMSKRIAILALR